MSVMPNQLDPAAFAAGTVPQQAPAPAQPAGKGKKGKKGAAEGGEEQPKKKKTKLIIGLVVVLALGFYMEKGKFMKPHYSAAHPPAAGVVYPLPTTSPFTVSTADGHMVQTSVALQLTVAASTKTIGKDEPAIENAVIQVLGSDTYQQLLSPAGRTAAQQQILVKVQKILGKVDGGQQVTGVLFTGTFVLQ